MGAAGLMALAGPASAINGSGTWTISTTSAQQITGTYTTPQGDAGAYTLTRTGYDGYQSDVTFTSPATGLLAHNGACNAITAGGCSSGGDTFTYQLTLTPTNPSIPLVTEVVQGVPTSNLGNSEPGRMTLTFSGTGVLAANPAVPLHFTNGTDWPAAGNEEQVRAYPSPAANPTYPISQATLDASYPALTVGSPITSDSSMQLFAVLNVDSGYRIDLLNSTSITVSYVGNMQNNAHSVPAINTALGETYNEWIGFGVRSLPLAKDDSYSVTNAAAATTASVLVNDSVGGVSGPAAGTYSLTPGTAPVPTAGSITMNPDGTITIAVGTTPGTYSYPYTLCDTRGATPSCVTAIATITVTAPAIPAAVPVGPWWLLLPPVLMAGGWSMRRRREQR